MSALKIRKDSSRHSAHKPRVQFAHVRQARALAVIADNQPPGLCAAALG